MIIPSKQGHFVKIKQNRSPNISNTQKELKILHNKASVDGVQSVTAQSSLQAQQHMQGKLLPQRQVKATPE